MMYYPCIFLIRYCNTNFPKNIESKLNQMKKKDTYLGYDHNIFGVQILFSGIS